MSRPDYETNDVESAAAYERDNTYPDDIDFDPAYDYDLTFDRTDNE